MDSSSIQKLHHCSCNDPCLRTLFSQVPSGFECLWGLFRQQINCLFGPGNRTKQEMRQHRDWIVVPELHIASCPVHSSYHLQGKGGPSGIQSARMSKSCSHNPGSLTGLLFGRSNRMICPGPFSSQPPP